MLLGRIIGTVVATRKDPRLEGSDANPKDLMCPVTDGVSETISLTRGELIDLIERVVSNLK